MMDVKGRISIKGRRMSVSSMISESFVYKTTDLESHVVSVNMSDSGIVTIKIDGSETSSYRKEILESHAIDVYVEKLHKRLAGAYTSISDYYLRMYAKCEKTYRENEVESLIANLKCVDYHEKPFELEKPGISEIESDLKVDAAGEGFVDQNEIDKFVAAHIEDSYNYRLTKWEKLQKYHSYVQSIIARIENERNKQLYETQKRALQTILEGTPSYIDKKIKVLETKLALPYSTDIDYSYDPDTGRLDLEMDSPLNISLPQRKICLSDTGELQIVKTSSTEDVLNQTKSKLSSMFYIAWSLWNITPKIKTINITNWQMRDQVGLCWFSFDRELFENIDPSKADVIELCKEVKHVFDLKDYSLSPIRCNLFEYAIQEGKYDDSTLLKFANRAKKVEEKPISKFNVEEPTFELGNHTTTINDLDYGYNLTMKPNFDTSFANWCYKLIENDECSLTMFVKDYGMSLDRAKDFMGKLLFMNFVGGKYGDGRRKVLIRTEAELEYRLSWVYHNESWKY